MVSLVTIVGALALSGGGISYFAYPLGLEMGIKTFLNLNEGGLLYSNYMNPPFASRTVFHIYAIKNPRDVLAGAKMQFDLKGPYSFDTYIERDNIGFSKTTDSVRFDSHRKLHLLEAASANLDEKLWMVNPILPSVQGTVKSIVMDRIPFQRVTEPIVYNTVNVLLDNFKERLIVKMTPRTLLLGRKVELLESITSLADRFGLKSLVPPGPPENIFGLAHFQNESIDPMEVRTGVEEPEKFGDVVKWRGKDRMTAWKGKCNLIKGTNGELYKPFLQKDPVSSDVVAIHAGLQALEYELSPRLFMGARNNPNNKCYCPDPRTYDCQYDGLIGMGPCFFDAPLFFARPNFKGMDRRIRSLIDEDYSHFDNIPEKQSFYIDAITGAVMKANLTLTGMFKIVRQPYMRDMAKLQNLTYAPIFVATETIELPNSLALPLKALQVMTEYQKPANIGMAIGGSGILLVKFLMRGRKAKKPEEAVNSDQTESAVAESQ